MYSLTEFLLFAKKKTWLQNCVQHPDRHEDNEFILKEARGIKTEKPGP